MANLSRPDLFTSWMFLTSCKTLIILMGPCKSPVSCTPNTFLDIIFFCSSLYVYSKAHQLIILHWIALKSVPNIQDTPGILWNMDSFCNLLQNVCRNQIHEDNSFFNPMKASLILMFTTLQFVATKSWFSLVFICFFYIKKLGAGTHFDFIFSGGG